MFYTVTLNPTLDRTMGFPGLRVGMLNRATSSRTDLSGKGVNVSRALHVFGIDSVVMGFQAGVYGRILAEGLCGEGFVCDLVQVEGETRSNVTVIDEARGVTTKLNEPGPTVSEADIAAFGDRLLSRLNEGDVCIFSGSLPAGAPDDTYARLIAGAGANGARTVLDTSGSALAAGCEAGPWLVKPNDIEAVELLSGSRAAAGSSFTAIESPESGPFGDAALLEAMGAILALGPRICLLTLGSEGAAYAAASGSESEPGVWWGRPPRVREVSAVGAGDAALAGMLWAWREGLANDKIVRWAVASGTAAAMEDGSGMPSLPRIREAYAQVEVMRLN